MIALVDYGAGNLTSVRKALAAIGANAWTPTVAGELGRAHGIIVPGVGHFDSTRALTADWRTAIKTMVDDGVPLLGICVGLQWLFEGSTEAPDVEGLSLFKGTCFNFTERVNAPAESATCWLEFPQHAAADTADGRRQGGIAGLLHAFLCGARRSTTRPRSASTAFRSAPRSSATMFPAVQFHPEKSGDTGLRILSNWLAQVKGE